MLENPRAPRVRALAKLATRKHRRDEGRFLIEGPQAVAEALEHRPDLVDEIIATEDALVRHPELASRASAEAIEIEAASAEVLEALSTTVTPQGVIAVCRMHTVRVRDAIDGGARLVVILHEVNDPGNAGTILRVADAVGADAVIVTSGSVDLHNPKVVRATTGSLFHLPIAVEADPLEAIDLARRAGLRVLAADVKGDDITGLRAGDALRAPTAWVFGNEARGLEDELLEACDASVRLPIYGSAESLNLATAASVCLYESAFAQRS